MFQLLQFLNTFQKLVHQVSPSNLLFVYLSISGKIKSMQTSIYAKYMRDGEVEWKEIQL